MNPADDNGQPESLEQTCNRHRAALKEIEERTRAIAAYCFAEKHAEAGAQAMLTVRHIEDARMRLGKVIQHTVGNGVSCWDSERKPADDGR